MEISSRSTESRKKFLLKYSRVQSTIRAVVSNLLWFSEPSDEPIAIWFLVAAQIDLVH